MGLGIGIGLGLDDVSARGGGDAGAYIATRISALSVSATLAETMPMTAVPAIGRLSMAATMAEAISMAAAPSVASLAVAATMGESIGATVATAISSLTVSASLASVWTPANMAGVKIFADPTTTSSSTKVEGASVSSISDLSANAFPNFTQSGGNRPTFKNTALSGLECWQFDAASSQSMVTTGTRANCMTTASDYWWAVIQPTTIATNAANGFQNLAILCDGQNNYRAIELKSSGPQAGSYFYSTSAEVSALDTLPGGLGATALVQVWHLSGVNYVKINNRTPVSAGSSLTLGGSQSLTLLLGRTAAGYYNGLLGPFGAAASMVSADQTALENWVNARYAIW